MQPIIIDLVALWPVNRPDDFPAAVKALHASYL
jgi:hypothetical protein